MGTCLLRNIDEFKKADVQSATSILGLMLNILNNGPTVGEIVLVSSHRPGPSLQPDRLISLVQVKTLRRTLRIFFKPANSTISKMSD